MTLPSFLRRPVADRPPVAPPSGAGGGAEAGARRPAGHDRRRDTAAAVCALVFFAAAAVAGSLWEHATGTLRAPWPPLLAHWLPHVGAGTPAAVLVGAGVVLHGPDAARRLPRTVLPWAVWGASLAWTWSLALVDGWHRGVADRLTTRYEYLGSVPRFHDAGAALRGFTGHILAGPGAFPPHVAGHPPAAVLTFVALDRAGLAGGGWAGAFCIVTGSSVAVAAVLALRALAGDATARAAAPFLVLTPGAVWVGASADAWFAAAAGWALALLALAATARSRRGAAQAGLGSGLLFGLALYLSYGLALLLLPAVAVLVCARSARPLPGALAGLAVVVAVFTLLGFRWWQAYPLLEQRYRQGSGGIRPYGYWLFGDLATVVASTGPATAAGLRRVLVHMPVPRTPTALARLRRPGARPGGPRAQEPAVRSVVLVTASFLLAVLAADLSGMSKGETERIWLPFTLWLPAAGALLPRPDHRRWLAVQACTALLINHLLLTYW